MNNHAWGMALILVFLPAASALSFSEYAFWFPEVPAPLTLASCAGLEKPVQLTPVAAQKPGFDGVKMAILAIGKMQSVRRMANLQKSPLFWGGANPAAYHALSLMCHARTAEAIRDAVNGVNANWQALDAALLQAKRAGFAERGPSQGIFRQLQDAKADIQNRNENGPSAGAAFVRALKSVQQAVENPALQWQAVHALIGPGGLLETQVRAVEAVEGLADEQADENRKNADRAAAAITDGKRLQKEMGDEKAFLVPREIFSLQTATFATSGTVQDFADAWRQAQSDLEDAAKTLEQGQAAFKKRENRYAAVAQSYLETSLDLATQARQALLSLKRQTGALEADLLKKTDAAKAQLQARLKQEPGGPAAWRLEQSLKTLDNPLSATRGERILELAGRLETVRRAMAQPADADAITADLEALAATMAAAEKNGVALGEEKKRHQALTGMLASASAPSIRQDTDALTNAVEEKIRDRFFPVLQRLEALNAYAGFLDVPKAPQEQYSGHAGTLLALEKKAADLEKKAAAGAAKWISENLEKTAEVRVQEPVAEVGRKTERIVSATYQNNLLFGTKAAVSVAVPTAAENQSGAVRHDAGMAIGQKTVTFFGVKPGDVFEAEWQSESVPVKLAALKTAITSARPSGLSAQTTAVLVSDRDQTALWAHDFGYAINGVQAPFEHTQTGSILRAKLDLKKGANTIAFAHAVPEPVVVSKKVGENRFTYRIENRLPLEFDLSFSVDDAAACPLQSPDLSATKLAQGLWRLEAEVALAPGQTRELRVFLDCPRASLENQSAFLEIPANLDAATRLALERANAALAQGKLDEAATLFMQIQQPPATADPLARMDQFRDLDAVTRELYQKAGLAENRGDASGLFAAQKELDSHLSAVKKSLEARAAAVCKNCPADVAVILKAAQSDIFLEKYGQAETKIASAQSAHAEHLADEQQKTDALAEAFGEVESADFSVAESFDAAFGVPQTATRWRSDNTGHAAAKSAAAALAKHIKELEALAKKNAEQKPVTAASVRLALTRAREEAQKLEAAVIAERQKAGDALELAEKAAQQAGSSTSPNALAEAKNDFSQGRFALAHYAAEKLTKQWTQNPASANAAASLAEWGAGLAALFVLGGLVWHFRKPEKPLEEL